MSTPKNAADAALAAPRVPKTLRFGIESLDQLFGRPADEDDAADVNYGNAPGIQSDRLGIGLVARAAASTPTARAAEDERKYQPNVGDNKLQEAIKNLRGEIPADRVAPREHETRRRALDEARAQVKTAQEKCRRIRETLTAPQKRDGAIRGAVERKKEAVALRGAKSEIDALSKRIDALSKQIPDGLAGIAGITPDAPAVALSGLPAQIQAALKQCVLVQDLSVKGGALPLRLFDELRRALAAVEIQTRRASEPSTQPPPAGVMRPPTRQPVFSVCIAGSSGTGKSALALHLAARYAADSHASPGTCILYASTDLSIAQAEKTWTDFHLYAAQERHDPFRGLDDPVMDPLEWAEDPNFPTQVLLKPVGVGDTAHHLVSPQPPRETRARHVGFVNLQSETAGDDWHFLNQVIAELPAPGEGLPAHLLVIDAIEGLEMLGGDVDSFGMQRTRRSRVAQIIRTAGDKCHIVFIVEGGEAKEHPEKFIADFVLRMRSTPVGDYQRRTIEVEKARGQAHVRGTHALLIREGHGSTTGTQQNPDDPKTSRSYIHVIPSLHFVSRSIMRRQSTKFPAPPDREVAEFGIRYLDDMLRLPEHTDRGGDERGLPCSSVTALTGDDGTQKSRLGHAFVGRNFVLYARCFVEMLEAVQVGENPFTVVLRDASAPAQQKYPSLSRACLRALGATMDGGHRTPPDVVRAKLVPAFDALLRERAGLLDRCPHGWATQRVEFVGEILTDIARLNPCASIIITTEEHDVDGLVGIFLRNISRKGRRWRSLFASQSGGETPGPGDKEAAVRRIEAILTGLLKHYTLCRRLEKHDISTPTMFHIIRQAVRWAQTQLFGTGTAYEETDARYAEGWRIRFLIEDWQTIRETYEEVRRDDIFLPSLLFYLRREGLTSLILQTRPGQPGLALDEGENTLQTLADHNLRTWRVRFKDEDRVAIAAIPPVATDQASMVRELKWESEQLDEALTVDPGLELYQGLQDGSPELTPLRIRLNGESPAFLDYARRMDRLLQEKFPGVESRSIRATCDDIDGPPNNTGSSYEDLRDLCHLQGENRLDHSLVFMVDEFWSLPDRAGGGAQTRRAQRASRLRDQSRYLGAVTYEKEWGADTMADPDGVFQPDSLSAEEDRNWKRRDFFSPELTTPKAGHGAQKNGEDAPDRIPFTTNFGFLFCRRNAWQSAAGEGLTFKRRRPLSGADGESSRGETKVTVGDVWRLIRLPLEADSPPGAGHDTLREDRDADRSDVLSWRSFLEACHVVAKTWSVREGGIAAFDLALPSFESLSSLTLEIWASEIARHGGSARVECVKQRRWSRDPTGVSLITWLTGDESGPPIKADLGPGNALDLYKTLLLIAEVLTEDALHQTEDLFSMPPADPRRSRSVASREWYTTATQFPEAYVLDDPLLPCFLPGHFSTRGDWFLAVARGSRSQRMADCALDLLSSSTSNIVRLQTGVGLPTRSHGNGRYDFLPTPLRAVTPVPADILPDNTGLADRPGPVPYHAVPLTYREVMALGPQKANSESQAEQFHWLWRSGLRDYDRHARIWQKWLFRELRRFLEIRHLRRGSWTGGFDVFDQLEECHGSGAIPDKILRLQTFIQFSRRCDDLVRSLKAATPRTGPPPVSSTNRQ